MTPFIYTPDCCRHAERQRERGSATCCFDAASERHAIHGYDYYGRADAAICRR